MLYSAVSVSSWLAKHSSLENIVIDYFLDPAGIIMAQTNAAAGSARQIESLK